MARKSVPAHVWIVVNGFWETHQSGQFFGNERSANAAARRSNSGLGEHSIGEDGKPITEDYYYRAVRYGAAP